MKKIHITKKQKALSTMNSITDFVLEFVPQYLISFYMVRATLHRTGFGLAPLLLTGVMAVCIGFGYSRIYRTILRPRVDMLFAKWSK